MPIDTDPCLIPEKPLGKLPARGHPKMLQLKSFVPRAVEPPPKAFNFWSKRVPFPPRTYGNRQEGCCTRASQANLATRMERLEQRRTINIWDEEIHRVYRDMTARLYGGGDTGAYEIDALNEWRRPDLTFRDESSRPLTIDAYTSINIRDFNEVKYAIWLAGAKGIKLCLNLPLAFSRIDPPDVWDFFDEGLLESLTGEWVPGSWGGHSLMADAYNEKGVRLVHTWYDRDDEQILSWRAFAAYCDEAYLVVDSANKWRKKTAGRLNITELVDAVNQVSSHKIKAA
jgi:hypothetical protein